MSRPPGVPTSTSGQTPGNTASQSQMVPFNPSGALQQSNLNRTLPSGQLPFATPQPAFNNPFPFNPPMPQPGFGQPSLRSVYQPHTPAFLPQQSQYTPSSGFQQHVNPYASNAPPYVSQTAGIPRAPPLSSPPIPFPPPPPSVSASIPYPPAPPSPPIPHAPLPQLPATQPTQGSSARQAILCELCDNTYFWDVQQFTRHMAHYHKSAKSRQRRGFWIQVSADRPPSDALVALIKKEGTSYAVGDLERRRPSVPQDRPHPRPQLEMVPQNQSDFAGALSQDAILATPSRAENRPFYCHRRYVNQGFSLEVGNQGFVRTATRQGDYVMLYVHVHGTDTAGWVEARFVHVNGDVLYGGDKRAKPLRLLLADGTAALRQHRFPTSTQHQGIWFETVKALLTAWRVTGAAIPDNIAEAIDTDAKILDVTSKLIEGYRKARGLVVLDRGSFHIEELLRVLRDPLDSRDAGNYIDVYDAGIRVGKTNDFRSRIQHHIQITETSTPIPRDIGSTHYQYARNAAKRRHRVICLLDEEYLRTINEQILYDAFETEAFTIRRFLESPKEDSGLDRKHFAQAIEAKPFIAMRDVVFRTTGWKGLARRAGSGIVDGLNVSVPICEGIAWERRIWVEYQKADGSRVFSTGAYPARPEPSGPGVRITAPGGSGYTFNNCATPPTVGTEVYPRFTILPEGYTARNPWYNSIELKMSNDHNQARGIFLDVLYEFQPGQWKQMNAMRINQGTKHTGQIEPHSADAMHMRRLLLRQQAESSGRYAKPESLGRIFRVRFNNWLQTIDVLQVQEVERVTSSVPTTWEERTAALTDAGAAWEPKVHTQCDYCRINRLNHCKWFKQQNAARCQNCLNIGIPCSFSSKELVSPGGAVFDLLARASIKYGKPEVCDIDDPQTLYKVVRDL